MPLPAMTVVTRFAPSPTGDLHPGHAYAAIFAYTVAAQAAGRFLVRIEDIDAGRCRQAFIERNLEDLRWLGLTWEEPVLRQSQRLAFYAAALARLGDMGVTYPCFCSRKEIRAEIEAAGGAPQETAEQPLLYPGSCRRLAEHERAARIAAGQSFAIRLDADRALRLTGPLQWEDRQRGPQAVSFDRLGDVVIARKELATSYHLAVVVDDAAQGVTVVTRGEDLFAATHIHRTLYALLGLPVPVWHHHRLCRDATGRRLAKRHGDMTIRALRERGDTVQRVLDIAAAAIGDDTFEAGGSLDMTTAE